MTGFVIGAAVAVALVLALLLRPFLRKTRQRRSRRSASSTRRSSASSSPSWTRTWPRARSAKDDYAQARAELQRRALEDTREAGRRAARCERRRRPWPRVALAVPVVAIALYLLIGNPGASMADGSAAAAHKNQQQDLERMVAALAAEARKGAGQPAGLGDAGPLVQGDWAASHEAEQAFERAGAVHRRRRADARELRGRGGHQRRRQLERQAGAADRRRRSRPTRRTRWRCGCPGPRPWSARTTTGRWRTWERLMALLPPGSEDARMLQGAMEEVRARAGKPSQAATAAAAAPVAAETKTAASALGKRQRHRGTGSRAQSQGGARRYGDGDRAAAGFAHAARPGARPCRGFAVEVHAGRLGFDEPAVAALGGQRSRSGSAGFQDRHGASPRRAT